MKKFFRFALIIAALFAGFSSCVKEPMEPASSDDLPYPENGKAVIEVSAVLPSEIRTKSTSAKDVNQCSSAVFKCSTGSVLDHG